MKVRTLSVLAGVSAPLILGGSADAGFVGIKVVGKDNPFGLFVCNVYAIFDRPGQDFVEAIAGTANAKMNIEVFGGVFFNTPNVGTDQAPSTFLISIFPSLAYDTFVTIGVKSTGANGQPKDNLTITTGFPWGITGSVLNTSQSGYGVTPLEAQGDPFNAAASFPGNGQILIGQFTGTPGTTAIVGTFLFQYTSNGNQFQQTVVSWVHVPSPGALALLGTAGLIGVRRRRRR